MNGWEVLNNIVGGFPFVVTALFALGALIALGIFIVGFSKYGVDFVKHGLKQKGTNDLVEKIDTLGTRFDSLEAKIDTRFAQVDAKIMAIETNHFGHLKNLKNFNHGGKMIAAKNSAPSVVIFNQATFRGVRYPAAPLFHCR